MVRAGREAPASRAIGANQTAWCDWDDSGRAEVIVSYAWSLSAGTGRFLPWDNGEASQRVKARINLSTKGHGQSKGYGDLHLDRIGSLYDPQLRAQPARPRSTRDRLHDQARDPGIPGELKHFSARVARMKRVARNPGPAVPSISLALPCGPFFLRTE